MNRHEQRVFLMENIYRHRLLRDDLLENLKQNPDFEQLDEFVINIIKDVAANECDYISQISEKLKKWSFERLNLVDQAILLLAYSELRLGLNERAIVINEALEISKKYSDTDNYRYINGVLDQL